MLTDLGDIVQYGRADGEAVIRLVENHRAVSGADLATHLTRPNNRTRYQRRNGKPVVRDLTSVDTILIHQTAVKGGFGVGDRKLAAVPGDPSDEDRALLARMGRYIHEPYHAIYSPRDRANLFQWPAWAWTYHGNGANRFSVGWAYDGKIPGDALDVDRAKLALAHTIEVSLDAGCSLKYVGAHRQHSANRGGDPGAEIWRDVVLPVAREFDLEASPRTTGTGRAVPGAWS